MGKWFWAQGTLHSGIYAIISGLSPALGPGTRQSASSKRYLVASANTHLTHQRLILHSPPSNNRMASLYLQCEPGSGGWFASPVQHTTVAPTSLPDSGRWIAQGEVVCRCYNAGRNRMNGSKISAESIRRDDFYTVALLRFLRLSININVAMATTAHYLLNCARA